MLSKKVHRGSLIVGACLLILGGGALPVVLNSPPEMYTYSADRIDGNDDLSPSAFDTAVNEKSTIASVETVAEHEREKLERSIDSGGSWTATDADSGDSYNYRYFAHRNRLYEVEKRDDPPAVRAVEIQGEEKLQALSVNVAELSDRTFSGVRRTDTPYEVVQQTIERQRYSSFTRVNADETILDHGDGYYRITAESTQNSNGFMLWALSVVCLSLSLLSGIVLLAYPVASYLVGSSE